MEAEAFLASMQDLRLPDGRARLVRHGHAPAKNPSQRLLGACLGDRIDLAI
jgi:hypothetical protein